MPREVSFRRARFPLASPPVPLQLLSVQELAYGGDVLSFIAVFNTTPTEPLVDPSAPPAADAAKWTARYNGGVFEASSLILAQYDQIEVGMQVIGAEAGANVLNYSNAPSDIGDTLARMLGAFAGFPLP